VKSLTRYGPFAVMNWLRNTVRRLIKFVFPNLRNGVKDVDRQRVDKQNEDSGIVGGLPKPAASHAQLKDIGSQQVQCGRRSSAWSRTRLRSYFSADPRGPETEDGESTSLLRRQA